MTDRKYPLNVTLRDGRKAVVLAENPRAKGWPLSGRIEGESGHWGWTACGRASERDHDIIDGLDTSPIPQPKTIKVQALVGVTADGEYFVLGRNDADESTLRFEIEEELLSRPRYTVIEVEVPLPDDAIETVQGRIVGDGA